MRVPLEAFIEFTDRIMRDPDIEYEAAEGFNRFQQNCLDQIKRCGMHDTRFPFQESCLIVHLAVSMWSLARALSLIHMSDSDHDEFMCKVLDLIDEKRILLKELDEEYP